MIPAFIGGVPGGLELVVILAIAILLFGSKKLPALARSLGQSTGEFKRGRQELEGELRSATSLEDAPEEADR